MLETFQRTLPTPLRVRPDVGGRFLEDSTLLERASALHHRARQGQWQLETDLPWAEIPRLEQVRLNPPLITHRLAVQWEGLPATRRASLVRFALTRLLGNLAHGETFVDDTASELSDRLENIDLARLTVFQAADEARHAQALERYLKTLEPLAAGEFGDPCGASPIHVASRLPEGVDIRQDPWQGVALLVLTLEIAALCAIQGLRTYCDEPLLQALLRRVIGDESRHVSTLILALRSPDGEVGLTPAAPERARIQQIALLSWKKALEVTEAPVLAVAQALDQHAGLPDATLDEQQEEASSTEWAWYRMQLARTFLPKLEALGLLDEALIDALAQAGCPVQAVADAA